MMLEKRIGNNASVSVLADEDRLTIRVDWINDDIHLKYNISKLYIEAIVESSTFVDYFVDYCQVEYRSYKGKVDLGGAFQTKGYTITSWLAPGQSVKVGDYLAIGADGLLVKADFFTPVRAMEDADNSKGTVGMKILVGVSSYGESVRKKEADF
jgi:hypothetical protein